MEQMLAHPDWVLAHTLVLLGFVSMLIGLILYGRSTTLPERTRRWIRLATIGTALQVVEMFLHTVAVVDSAHLLAGEATPVLTTHLVLAIILYPVFGASVVGLVVAGVRDRALGSVWIAWIGILGAVGHGLSAPLVAGLGIRGAGILFPMLLLLALWLLLTGVWPARRSSASTVDAILSEPTRA